MKYVQVTIIVILNVLKLCLIHKLPQMPVEYTLLKYSASLYKNKRLMQKKLLLEYGFIGALWATPIFPGTYLAAPSLCFGFQK